MSFGRVLDKTLADELGPTPFPSTIDIRNWDFKLLNKYKPFYMPLCDVCCLCTFGKCDLSQGKRGACGLDMAAQQSRIVLIACCIGAATHLGHERHIIDHLVKEFGGEVKIDVGKQNIAVEAPITRLVCGIKPIH